MAMHRWPGWVECWEKGRTTQRLSCLSYRQTFREPEQQCVFVNTFPPGEGWLAGTAGPVQHLHYLPRSKYTVDS